MLFCGGAAFFFFLASRREIGADLSKLYSPCSSSLVFFSTWRVFSWLKRSSHLSRSRED